jgi:hypothetical protein
MAFFSWTNLRFLGNSWSGVSFPSNNENRRIILYAFDILPDTAKLPGPKFVFSHIVAPHPPYIFNSVGEPVDQVLSHPEVGTPGYSENILQFRQAYLDQLTFINQKTLKMIDGILARSKTPPVIILQGDHGPDVFMDINDPGKACLYERYSILNAYYLPNVPAEAIPADISPVNSFRFIFNRYFGTNLEMLANRRYFSPDTHFYQFQDVTNQTESKCNLPPGTSP